MKTGWPESSSIGSKQLRGHSERCSTAANVWWCLLHCEWKAMNIKCCFGPSIVLSWQLLCWEIVVQQSLMVLSHRLTSSLLNLLPALYAHYHTSLNLMLHTVNMLIATTYVELAAIFNLSKNKLPSDLMLFQCRRATNLQFSLWNWLLRCFREKEGGSVAMKTIPCFFTPGFCTSCSKCLIGDRKDLHILRFLCLGLTAYLLD